MSNVQDRPDPSVKQEKLKSSRPATPKAKKLTLTKRDPRSKRQHK